MYCVFMINTNWQKTPLISSINITSKFKEVIYQVSGIGFSRVEFYFEMFIFLFCEDMFPDTVLLVQ